jgi:NAD+ synthase (glutamine-hydrolysing)
VKVGLAQINTTVGDLPGNCAKIINAYREAVTNGAEVVLTPELAVTGYPPQDLVFKSRFVPLNIEMLDRLRAEVGATPLVVGFMDRNDGPGGPFRNAVAVIEKGQPVRKVYKTLLPTYDVFDEDRYYEPAMEVEPVQLAGRRCGLTICEDVWVVPFLPRQLYLRDPVRSLVSRGAEIIFNISGSPFHVGKPRQRIEMLSKLAAESRRPLAYCNALGGNDHLIFDGNSLAFDARGRCLAQLPAFQECVRVVDMEAGGIEPAYQSEPEELHDALVLGLRDYAGKCGFKSAVLGLSGGIDSAVTAAIATEALGPEAVHGVTMPTQFSSGGSIEDSRLLARNLGIHFYTIPIQRSFETFKEQLRKLFAGLPEDTTEENIQPRLRGMTLMALSNKFGHLLLTTGNKSELAVGYCTIYGDMAGGLAVISDVPKTKIYDLAQWINRDSTIIPSDTLTKPPSAELKPGQWDQDTLPPYELLDQILQLYVEEAMTARDIIARGYEEKTVRWVARRVDLNEWKRAQAAPGLKVTCKAFGLGRRMPLAQRFVD